MMNAWGPQFGILPCPVTPVSKRVLSDPQKEGEQYPLGELTKADCDRSCDLYELNSISLNPEKLK